MLHCVHLVSSAVFALDPLPTQPESYMAGRIQGCKRLKRKRRTTVLDKMFVSEAWQKGLWRFQVERPSHFRVIWGGCAVKGRPKWCNRNKSPSGSIHQKICVQQFHGENKFQISVLTHSEVFHTLFEVERHDGLEVFLLSLVINQVDEMGNVGVVESILRQVLPLVVPSPAVPHRKHCFLWPGPSGGGPCSHLDHPICWTEFHWGPLHRLCVETDLQLKPRCRLSEQEHLLVQIHANRLSTCPL